MTCKSSPRWLSVNAEVDPDIASLLGASAALAISGMPFMGPIGARASATWTASTFSIPPRPS